jgi:hypothetical protein
MSKHSNPSVTEVLKTELLKLKPHNLSIEYVIYVHSLLLICVVLAIAIMQLQYYYYTGMQPTIEDSYEYLRTNTRICSHTLFPLDYLQFQKISLASTQGLCNLFTIQNVVALTDEDVFNCSRKITHPLSKCIECKCTIKSNSTVLCVFRYICP